MKPQNMTILTVDDTPANIRLLTHYLEKQGYRVLTAEDGFEGFKAAILNHPDLVLLDVMMPGTDGYEVCELLKAEEETKDIPVVFLTAKADPEDRVKGFELGAVDYITKPFNLVEISSRVKTHLRLRYLEGQQSMTRRILMQTQKQASLGESDAVFFGRLASLSSEIRTLAKKDARTAQESSRLVGLSEEVMDTLEDLKSFSNTTAFDKDRISLNELVDSVAELVRPTVHVSVQIEIDLPKVSPIVTGNIGMLHQAVLNLMLNAFESAVGGGTIKAAVSLGHFPENADSSATNAPAAECAIVSVDDAAPRKEPIRFDPIGKIYGTAHNNLNAGIRFTAAHAIAERHGGMFRLQPGNGGCMNASLFLPVSGA
jgi:DNA-binding response OmpR family regulator